MRAVCRPRAPAGPQVPAATRRPVATAIRADCAASLLHLLASLPRAAARHDDDVLLATVCACSQGIERTRSRSCSQQGDGMTDNDELDAEPFLEHDFRADGVRDFGLPRLRCSRCGVLAHWPAAHATCVQLLVRFQPLALETEPLYPGQHPGPYVGGEHPTCAICSRQYRRNRRHGGSTTCSIACAATQKRTSNREQARRLRASKRGQS